MATIITDAVVAGIATFCGAFADRYMMQPPEFTDIRYLDSFSDLYERDVRGAINPVNTEWFARLQVSATAADIDALDATFHVDDSYECAIQRFVLRRLLRSAYRRDQAGMEVSAAIPVWYRAKGWGLPDNWNCERPAPAAATPPGSPLPAGPAWRTGSCGESGPFIGLSYPYSIALIKRMASDPDGHTNAFRLRDAVCASDQPDVLRDFTVQEVIDGMAGSYSWSRERSLDWLTELVAAAGAVEDAEAEALWARLEAEGSPTPSSPVDYGPAWRQGSCGESGPFIALAYPYSIALVKRMAADPDGRRNAFQLKEEVCAGPRPDVQRDFTTREIVDGMAGSYSWSRDRTMEWLKHIALVQAVCDAAEAAAASSRAAASVEE
jgi:hypothetical protein